MNKSASPHIRLVQHSGAWFGSRVEDSTLNSINKPGIAAEAGGLRWRVEPAEVGDAPDLAKLRWTFRSEVSGDRMVVEEAARFLIRCSDWMAEKLTDPSWRAWCGRVGETVVGTALAQIVQKVPNPVREGELLGYVTNVYVVPEHRGQGMGQSLTAVAVDWCRRRGAEEVLLWPTGDSRSMYGQFGFEPACTIFRRVFPPEQPDPAKRSLGTDFNEKIQVVKTTILS